MPRKTLALISGLVIVTVILAVVAIRGAKPQPPINKVVPTPTSVAHSLLTLSPNPVNVAVGQKGTVEVNIDTADNSVTAVQLELAYDPNIISDVQVVAGALFQNPVVLINKNNVQGGRLTYAFGIMPNKTTVQGKGVAATITFTAKNVPGKQSQLALLPTSLVTARGVSSSVLKSATGTLINVLPR